MLDEAEEYLLSDNFPERLFSYAPRPHHGLTATTRNWSYAGNLTVRLFFIRLMTEHPQTDVHKDPAYAPWNVKIPIRG